MESINRDRQVAANFVGNKKFVYIWSTASV